MSKRTLLVTFDAFGTLFVPYLPVAVQYSNVARQHGVHASPEDIERAFYPALEAMKQEYPNYGKGMGMTPEDWWTRLITTIFTPHHPRKLPPTLSMSLIHHFSTSAAYSLHPSIKPLLHSLRCSKDTVCGVISNSDPRVHSILRSLKLRMDFVMLSYDVGVEKPHPEIFRRAEKAAIFAYDCKNFRDVGEWRKVHVGDDVERDIQGAEEAGWTGVLWNGEAGQEEMEGVRRKIEGEEGGA